MMRGNSGVLDMTAPKSAGLESGELYARDKKLGSTTTATIDFGYDVGLTNWTRAVAAVATSQPSWLPDQPPDQPRNVLKFRIIFG